MSDIKSDEQVFEEMLKSAKKGIAGAQFSVGKRYYEGKGISKDKVRAYMWIQLAKFNGHNGCEDNMFNLYDAVLKDIKDEDDMMDKIQHLFFNGLLSE